MYENKVIVMGNITRKPELKQSTGGTMFCGLNIAVNSVWFDKQSGEKKESVEFISVSVFGKTAENCAQYLDKGQKVYVEGKIKNRVEEKDGEKRYHTGIVADQVKFGPKPQGTGEDRVVDHTTNRERPATMKETMNQPAIHYPTPEEEGLNLDDIPF